MKKAVEPRRLEKKAKGKEERRAGNVLKIQEVKEAVASTKQGVKDRDDEIDRFRNVEKSMY